HKNMPPARQAKEVEKVKKYESGMILDPITIHPEESLQTVAALKRKYKITGMPVVDENRKLVGILTSRDMAFEDNLNQKVKDIMTPKERLICASADVDMEEAKKLLHKHRIEKLPVINKEGELH